MKRLNCPHCKTNIAKSINGEVKMRVKLLKWNDEGVFAVCKACTQDVPISLDFFKALSSRYIYEAKK